MYASNESGTWELYGWDKATDKKRQLTDRKEGTLNGQIEPLGDFGIEECALYPIFNEELLGLFRRLVPAERLGRIARSVFVRGRKPAPDESLPGRARG